MAGVIVVGVFAEGPAAISAGWLVAGWRGHSAMRGAAAAISAARSVFGTVWGSRESCAHSYARPSSMKRSECLPCDSDSLSDNQVAFSCIASVDP
jgi:hypothetical protein